MKKKPALFLRYPPSEIKSNQDISRGNHESLTFQMSRYEESLLTFGTLYRSELATIREYRCCAARGGPQQEEQADANSLVFISRGSFCKHIGRHAVVADVNQVAFFSKERSYRVSHATDCGDSGLIVSLAPNWLCEIVATHDPSVADRPDAPFPFLTGPCDRALFRQHRALSNLLAQRGSVAPFNLSIEVACGELANASLSAAFARSGTDQNPCRQHSRVDRREQIEAAKLWMSSRLGENIELSDIARVAELSPFHFSRLFREVTGLSPHRYLVLLRLRTALQRIEDGATNLSHLALDLGFSSHSHLTDSFRREFGVAPSRIRNPGRNSQCFGK